MKKLINLLHLLFIAQLSLITISAQIEQRAELVVQTGHTDRINSIVFSPDGKLLISGSSDNTVKLWNVESGKEIKAFVGHNSRVFSAAFSSDGKVLATGSLDKTIKIWNIQSGQIIKTLSDSNVIVSVVFSPDGKVLATGGRNQTVKLWDVESGQVVKTLTGHTEQVNTVIFSPDGKTIASGSYDKTIKVWDVKSGRQIKSFEEVDSSIYSVEFSPDGKNIASGNSSGEIKLWNVQSGKIIKTFDGVNFALSPDGKTLASFGILDNTVRLWSVESGKELKNFQVNTETDNALTFSPDGKIVAFGLSDYTIQLWNVESGKKIRTLVRYIDPILSIIFPPVRNILLSVHYYRNIRLWNLEGNSFSKTFYLDDPKIKHNINAIVPDSYESIMQNLYSYYPIGEMVLWNKRFQIKIVENGKLNLYEIENGRLLASLISLIDNNWAVITPEGLFDASAGAKELMHFVIGLEPIALEQMKDLYYVPNLLQKVLKEEPLPKVGLFSKKDLFPDVEFSPLKAGQKKLDVKLTNRGGGIGQVQVLVNGKEFIKDARPERFFSNASEINLKVDLKNAPLINGAENKIEVIARNASGSLNNRGTPRGSEIINLAGESIQKETPNIYVIAGGISKYTGDNLKLNFAAKDAEDFAKAIELGASKLLDDKSKVHIRLLTSNGANSNVKFSVPDAKISTATKKDFENAFADFKTATPNDVFIVYLAGHGVSLNLNQNPNQAGGDTYLYLTQEATTTDKSVLSIENSRKAMAISSEELKDLMKTNKALKQVLILDTCAAGALSNSLVAKRDLPSDQIRAIERLKDNTGFYVLMGSSADAVSYEASQYGQGLLTYSLLQAMKGARLRENQFADVGLLFGYAQETVPTMAKNIGGIQRPLIITPDNSNPFDIGKFTTDEQKLINLSNRKPIILRPSLQNKEQNYDDLDLTKTLYSYLREANFAAARGEESSLVFVDADEMTDAVKPSGSYIIKDNEMIVTIRLILNKIPFETIEIRGKVNQKDNLVKEITANIVEKSQMILKVSQ